MMLIIKINNEQHNFTDQNDCIKILMINIIVLKFYDLKSLY
jgi:hypothetical protein